VIRSADRFRGDEGGHRTDGKVRERGPHHHRRPDDIGGVHPSPLVGGRVESEAESREAGCVHEEVDAAEPVGCLRHDRLTCLGVADITDDGEPATGLLDGIVEPVAAPPVEGDLRAAGGEPEPDLTADPRRRSDHEGALAQQGVGHHPVVDRVPGVKVIGRLRNSNASGARPEHSACPRHRVGSMWTLMPSLCFPALRVQLRPLSIASVTKLSSGGDAEPRRAGHLQSRCAERTVGKHAEGPRLPSRSCRKAPTTSSAQDAMAITSCSVSCVGTQPPRSRQRWPSSV
jgi:hypothetical protein